MASSYFNQDINKEIFDLTFSLKCYPISFIEKFSNCKGDKILLPSSILENITNKDVKWPLIFEIFNKESGRKTHCGVLEFTSDEGCAYLPYWMIKNLFAIEGETLFFKYANLDKGNYVKIQPQTSDFLDISNPRAVLESNLRFFTCLTKDDSIAIDYNDKIYWLNVLEVKPGNAISIIETDINVDFSLPMCTYNKEKNQSILSDKTNDTKILEKEFPPDSDETSY
nr:ubiquitin fusion degradation protein [Cryptomonas curvata]|mmetsp:Transcript_705/g.1501  ORF Transcript_705/g.1501 Transcript_705/m.1501 type:complete len:225 (-) Transcript_705:1422-2096(-)